MKTAISAIAILVALGLSAAPANAACSPSISPITDGVSIDVSGCHLQIQHPAVLPVSPSTEFVIRNPATGEIGTDGGAIAGIVIGAYNSLDTRLDSAESAIGTLQTTVSSHGTDIGALQIASVDHEGRIVTLETDSAAHGGAITALQSQTAAQQTQLDDHEGRITAGEAKNTEQDDRLDANDVKNGEQDDAIEAEKVRNDGQDERLDKQKKAIKANYAWDKKQQGQINGLKQENQDQWDHIGSLETVQAQHGATLNAHSALLSQHSAKLDEHSRGLAIAMAMPDAWLSDKKRFGVFGAVGGFEDETAVGFAAIGRIDETWTLNIKGGSDTEFKSFGWQVGAGAQW